MHPQRNGSDGRGGKGRRMAKKGVVVMSYNASMPASPKHQKLLFKASAYFTCEEKKTRLFLIQFVSEAKNKFTDRAKDCKRNLKKKGKRIRPKHSNLY